MYLLFSFFILFSTSLMISSLASASSSSSSSSLMTVAFGSCNQHDHDQSFWPNILTKSNEPDNKLSSFIWLGDIVYIDECPACEHFIFPYSPVHVAMSPEKTKSIWQHMRRKNPDYQKLVDNTRTVLGVYDDHDMGMNDAGADCAEKEFNQQNLLDFLDVESLETAVKKNNKEAIVRRERAGVYNFQKIPFPGKENDKTVKPVCVILLDFRTHRDPPLYDGTGNVLGEDQWTWLETVLKTGQDPDIESDDEAVNEKKKTIRNIDDVCQVTVLGSSVQIVLDAAVMEVWGEYRNERNRLFRTIAKSGVRRIFSISGDIHYSEVGVLSHVPVTRKNGMLGSLLVSQEEHQEKKTDGDELSPLLYERCPESIWPDQDFYEITSSGLTHHEDRNIVTEDRYNSWFPTHRRVPPGVWIRKNVGLFDIVCQNASDAETCKVISRLYELPMMKEIMTTEISFVPESKRIKNINLYFKEKYPDCVHLHDVENDYDLAPYPGPWTASLDWMKISFPSILGEVGRLDLIYVQFYSGFLLFVVLLLSTTIGLCCLVRRGQHKAKKE